MSRPLGFALLLAALPALAWDTKEDPKVQWHSPYLNLGAPNEHAFIADAHLAAIGAGAVTQTGAYGTDGASAFRMFDLTASMEPRDTYGLDPRGDDPKTLIEERILPPPSSFAGLPDWSYGLYDWINKNTLCPVLPADVASSALPGGLLAGLNGTLCHAFFGWMGALNANHFGSQATLTYQRLHALALTLAVRAAEFRNALDPSDQAAWRDFIIEAELEALAVEGYAQHFLQDRWSMGHMWERWGPSDFSSLQSKSILENLLVASYSGLVHGAESVLLKLGVAASDAPDPMCSPDISGSSVLPVEYVAPGGGIVPGVGDYRFADMQAGQFMGLPMNVATQRSALEDCGQRGWAEVIQAFGPAGGPYGELELPALAVPVEPPGPACFAPYATNEAMRRGADTGFFNLGATTLIGLVTDTSPVLALLTGRTARTVVSWRIFKETLLDPKGTSLAKGAIGRLGPSDPGSAFQEVADHVEPVDLDSLPLIAPLYTAGGLRPGRDRRTWFGFFNRAHTDYWCQNLAETLTELRASDEDVDHEVCAYLATRAYAGTDTTYAGPRAEASTIDGIAANPICSYFGVTSTTDPEVVPVRLHPGYVHAPGEMAPHGHSLASVQAWCDRVPVVDVDNEDVSATLFGSSGGTVTITGRHFGKEGSIAIGSSTFSSLEVSSWTDGAIQLVFDADALPVGDYSIVVTRTKGQDGAPSLGVQVGAAVLRVAELTCEYEMGEANECVPGTITVNGDADLAKLEGLDCIGGTLNLTAVTNLSGVTLPRRIDGVLRIKQSAMQGVVDLSGLESVDTIEILSNSFVTAVRAPDLLIANKVTLKGPALVSVELPKLTCVGETLDVVAFGETPILLGSLRQAGILIVLASAEVDLHSLQKLGYPQVNSGLESRLTISSAGGPGACPSGVLDLPSLVEAGTRLRLTEAPCQTLSLSKLTKGISLEVAGMNYLTQLKLGALSQLGGPGVAGALTISSNPLLPTSQAEGVYEQVCGSFGFYPIGGQPYVYIASNAGCKTALGEPTFCDQSTCTQACTCTHFTY